MVAVLICNYLNGVPNTYFTVRKQCTKGAVFLRKILPDRFFKNLADERATEKSFLEDFYENLGKCQTNCNIAWTGTYPIMISMIHYRMES